MNFSKSLITNSDKNKIHAIITWFIIIVIPTYSKTFTVTDNGSIREGSLQWPWLILTRYTPNEEYRGYQYDVVAFPWSYILFIPFLYACFYAYGMFVSSEKAKIQSQQIVIASIIQILLIFMVSKSQDMDEVISENVNIYYIPQIALILLHGYLFIKQRRTRGIFGNSCD